MHMTHHVVAHDMILGETLLHWACISGHLPLITLLLERPDTCTLTQRDTYGRTPMYIAAQYDHIYVIDLLYLYGASVDQVNEKQRTPLHGTRGGGGDNDNECYCFTHLCMWNVPCPCPCPYVCMFRWCMMFTCALYMCSCM